MGELHIIKSLIFPRGKREYRIVILIIIKEMIHEVIKDKIGWKLRKKLYGLSEECKNAIKHKDHVYRIWKYI